MADAIKKSENVKAPRALGCYVTLLKPRAMEAGKEPEYSIALLWPKAKAADLAPLRKAIAEAAVSKFGPGAVLAPPLRDAFGLKLLNSKLRNPFRDGDEKVELLEGGEKKNAEYEGTVYVNARSKQRVSIIDTNHAPVDPAEVYSGCFFHASLRFYPYDQKGNRGVGCGLQSLMLVHKGKAIAGRVSAEKDFENFVPDVEGLEGDEGLSDMF